jgi:hypothetical protein
MITSSSMRAAKRLRTGLMVLGGMLTAGLLLSQSTALALPAGDTFTVTNQLDSGAGSLRQAISDANNNANPGEQDIIEFNIPVNGFPNKDIVPESQLVITEPVLVDGYTQGDAEPNTANWPSPFNGTLRIEIYNTLASGGLEVGASDVELRGLVINGSPTVELDVTESDNFILEGSYLGVDTNGYSYLSNENNVGGVRIADSDNIRIGGAFAEERNVMGFCMEACVEVSGTAGNPSTNPVIQGNYIGVGIDGLTPLRSNLRGGTGIVLNRYVEDAIVGGASGTEGNTLTNNTHGAIWGFDISNLTIQGNRIINNLNWGADGAGQSGSRGGGIYLAGVTNSVIGGSEAGRNVVAGNLQGSVVIADSEDTSAKSQDITISHNYIGVMDDGETPYPNSQSGILIADNSEYILIQSNTVHNTDSPDDLFVDGITAEIGTQNISILQNSIYNNRNMGIDLGGGGPSANDVNDDDAGANGFLNYPTYYDTEESGGNTTIYYSYNGPADDYRIEFFSNTTADSPGPGEGETYLGFDEITQADTNTDYYSVTVPGVGHDNISLTATAVDDTAPSGYGATSEFGGAGDPPPPITDIVAEKRILNPEDATIGSTVDYEITIRNDGPDSIDIGDYDSSTPGLNQLFIDMLPPEATYAGVSGTNISCVSAGPNSASMFGPALADHSDHELVFCGWNGGSHVLDAGDEVTAIVSAEVVDDAEPNFINYVVGFVPENDPDIGVATASYTSGDDIITFYQQLASNTYNNVYWTDTSITDTSVTKVLENEGEITSGTTVNYTLTFSNAGPNNADLTYYNGGGFNPVATSMFVDVLPSSLDFVGSSNPDVACMVAGPSSLAPYFAEHPDYNILLCIYVGAETELLVGESIATTISATANQDVEEGLTNYVFSGLNEEDPDYLFSYYNLAMAASSAFGEDRRLGDFLTRLNGSDRNFAQAAYGLDDSQEPGGGGDNGGSGSGQSGSGGDLANTGQSLIFALVLALIILGCSIELLRRSRSTYRPR